MSRRFKYEAPGALRKAALTLFSPHNWRSKTRPWIFDNDSGVSFQLAVDEDAVLGRLTSRMTQDERAPDVGALEPAFDHVVQAIMKKRRGYVSDWHRLTRWTPREWDNWLGSLQPKG
jgi:hypothetical protein